MKTFAEYIQIADKEKWALGHFNVSNLEGVWSIFRAAESLQVPAVIGLSEGERAHFGLRAARAVVDALRMEYDYPVFLSADHSYSLEEVKRVVDAGFDAVVVDGSRLSLEENIAFTKEAVDYVRRERPDILVEGEIGHIGSSSKLLDDVPADVVLVGADLPSPEIVADFVKKTGVDLLSPAVGNLHGMLKSGHEPRLAIELITSLRDAAGVPLILHGGSGITDTDFVSAIEAGVSMVHINTEIRVIFRDALKLYLQDNPDEISPYKIMAPAMHAMEKRIRERLQLFRMGHI